jgi:hypothetical protein
VEKCTDCSIIGSTFSNFQLGSAIYVEGSDNINIKSNMFNHFTTSDFVIHVANSSGAQIVSNTMTNFEAFYTTSFVEVFLSDDVIISSNILSSISVQCVDLNSDFIAFNFNDTSTSCSRNVIKDITGTEEDCITTIAAFNVSHSYNQTSQFTQNLIEYINMTDARFVRGFYLGKPAESSGLLLDSNNITGLVGQSVYGILINGIYSITIANNTMHSLSGLTLYGVYITDSTDLLIYNNNIEKHPS